VPRFKPQWNARKGVAELYDAYRRYGVTLEAFEGVRFQRVAHIKHLLATGQLHESLRWKSSDPRASSPISVAETKTPPSQANKSETHL
jgi:hypothetical protein